MAVSFLNGKKKNESSQMEPNGAHQKKYFFSILYKDLGSKTSKLTQCDYVKMRLFVDHFPIDETRRGFHFAKALLV